MAEYNTEQRKRLLDFMKKHSGRALSVDEWTKGISAEADAPSRATVYRTLLKLEKQGLVISTKEKRHIHYQLADCDHGHLHLKCITCGRLIHASHRLSKSLERMISRDSDFSLDQKQTVIYGVCSECKK